MCFSATASFAAGAVLIPMGAVAMARARRSNPAYLSLASFPLLFGLQQMLEGWLWLSLGTAGGASRLAALGFLVFAYLLWLVLTPLAVWRVEPHPGRRRLFLVLAGIGAAYGLSLFLPLLLAPDWLRVALVRGSILYDTRTIYDGVLSRTFLRAVYVGVICGPLLACTAPGVRGFGILVTLSVAVAFLFATHAFTSIWCYLAAGVSAWLLLVILRLPPAGRGAARPAAR